MGFGRRYLVAVNVVVFVYSTVQFIQLMVTVILGMSFIPSILISTWMTFGFDQVSFLTSYYHQFSECLGIVLDSLLAKFFMSLQHVKSVP